MDDRNLLAELFRKRDSIKNAARWQNERAPIVCNDEALFEMARLKPKTLDDFYAVPKIGKNFVNEYGNEFLEIIHKYTVVDNEKEVDITSKIENVLKELSNKLVSLNRKNHLLFLPKLSNKYTVDISKYLFSITSLNNDSITIDDNNRSSIFTKLKTIKEKVLESKKKKDEMIYISDGHLLREDYRAKISI